MQPGRLVYFHPAPDRRWMVILSGRVEMDSAMESSGQNNQVRPLSGRRRVNIDPNLSPAAIGQVLINHLAKPPSPPFESLSDRGVGWQDLTDQNAHTAIFPPPPARVFPMVDDLLHDFFCHWAHVQPGLHWVKLSDPCAR